MLGLGVSSSLLGGAAFTLENSILAAFKTRVLADSGEVENYACLNLDVKDLITEWDGLSFELSVKSLH